MQRHILHRNSPPPLYCLPPPLFSLILHSGAKMMHSTSTHTPCNAIVKFHFFANLVISYGIERRKDPAGVGRNSMCQNSCGQSPCAVSLTSMSVHCSPLPSSSRPGASGMGGVSTDAVTSMVIFYHQSPWMMPSTWSDGDTNRDDQDDCHELSSTHISFLCNQIFPGFKAPGATGKHFHKSPRVWRLLERPGAFWG